MFGVTRWTFRPVSSSSISEEDKMGPVQFKLLICGFVLGGATMAQAACLQSVSELKANDIKTSWRETTANDGKPLTIVIDDGAGGLAYTATKAGEPWLTGRVSVCRSGDTTKITLSNTQATSNVPALARMALPSTQSADIIDDQIELSGGAWSGTFVGG